jgi:hypothetical protein
LVLTPYPVMMQRRKQGWHRPSPSRIKDKYHG